ncbi:MAG: hypothetical protein K6T91_09365 [Firmicutes bacterium]|nr:hypothetical protein [Bacillota bacterium]
MGDEISKDKNNVAPGKSEAPEKDGKTLKKSSGKSAAKSEPADGEVAGLSMPKQVDFMWTVALVVVAFVFGFFVGALLKPTSTTPTSSGLSDYSTQGQSGSAPPLSSEQLNSGQLPAGHPSIGGDSTQSSSSQTQVDQSSGHTKSDVPASGDIPPGGQSVEVKPGEDKK